MSKDSKEVNVNSVGGSDRHQELLNHFHHRLSGNFTIHPNSLSHPDMDVVTATIMTIAAPHNDDGIRSLSQGRDGITDGKVLLIDQDVMVDRIRNSDFDAWFNQVMRDVLATARGQGAVHLQSVSVSDMEKVLQDRMNPDTWRAKMGYDDARRSRFPALEALESTNASDDFGQGDFNQSAGQVLNAYKAAMTAQKIGTPEARDQFLKDGATTVEGFELHGFGVRSFYLTWLAANAFGVGEAPHEKHGTWPSTQDEKIQAIQAFAGETTTGNVCRQMIDVTSGCNRFSAFKDWDLLSSLGPKPRRPKP